MDKEKWIDNIMESLEGSERARPDDALFDKIEQRVMHPETRIIPLGRVRVAAVAAVLLLMINGLVINEYLTNDVTDDINLAEVGDGYDLLSNYEIYN